VSALAHAQEVLDAEVRALQTLHLGTAFEAVVDAVLACRGRVVVSGLGKSGLVGQKISATLASTGTPSLFLHAVEAGHGDLGRITPVDLVLVLSNSGESEDVLRLIRPVKSLGAKLVALVGDPDSQLARHSDFVLSIGHVAEGCPMGLVPTASTTAMMAVGDCLAIALFRARGLGPRDYARFHPAGVLGRKVITVAEVMRTGERNPVVQEDASVRDALAAMTSTRSGAAAVCGQDGRLVGFYTDGDLRRHLLQGPMDLATRISEVMHRSPRSIRATELAASAARMLREHEVDQVPVVDQDDRPVGLLDIQDILATGLT
jgi:arabinose-5-phosphate isomerase